MTQKEIKQMQKKLQKKWDYIRGYADTELWLAINDAVDLELLLEAECNK